MKKKYLSFLIKNPAARFWVNKTSLISSCIIIAIIIIQQIFIHWPVWEFILYLFLSLIYVLFPICLIRWIIISIKEYIRCLHIYNDLHSKNLIIKFKSNRKILAELDNYLKERIAQAKYYTNIINTTTDEEKWNESYSATLSILNEIVIFEKYNVFTEMLPSENIKELKEHYYDAYETFLDRKSKNINRTIIEDYDLMEGHDFEYFCADLLRKNGFINVEVTQGSGDHGIDILAEKDDISYAIQCKCYSSNIGNAAVQQAHTGKSLYKKNVAVVLTNRYFTAQAKEEAQQLGVKLWDRDKLNVLIDK